MWGNNIAPLFPWGAPLRRVATVKVRHLEFALRDRVHHALTNQGEDQHTDPQQTSAKSKAQGNTKQYSTRGTDQAIV